MGHGVPVSTKAIFRTALLVAAALVLAACGGGETSEGATGNQSQSTDPCSGPLPTDGFALDTVADIPTFGDDGSTSTLGADEAEAILDELLDPELSMCSLEVSSGVQEAIDAVRAAAARGDESEVRRLLEQLIRVEIQAAATPIKSLRNFYAPEDRQKARDAAAAAAEAQAQGHNDLAEEAMDQAREHYTNYAATAISATDDVRALLTIAAEAQLFGLDDVASDAIEKAIEILEMELEEITGRYDPCTANAAEFRELAIATARVQLIGGDSSEGDELISRTIEIQIQRANGETVPECDAVWSLVMTMDVESDAGDVAFVWDGFFSITEGKIEGDGVGTVLGTGECQVNDATVQVFDVTGTFSFTVTGTQTVSGNEERLNLRVKSTEAEVQLDAGDSACAVLVDIVRVFLGSVPTFPELYRPGGIDVQVIDGVGSAEVTFEPYLLEVSVTNLGE